MSILNSVFQTSDRNDRILNDARDYFRSRYDLLKLEFLEKSAKILGGILLILTVLVAAFVVLVFLSQALISWLAQFFETAAPVYLICAAMFVCVIMVALFCKEKLFINPVLRMLYRIMYEDDHTDEEKGGKHV